MNAVLLIPVDGDPHGLLTPGKYGAMPPIARHCLRCECPGDAAGAQHHYGGCKGAPPYWSADADDAHMGTLDALVLAWEGEPAPEGIDRALRILHSRIDFCALALRGVYTTEYAETVARSYARSLGYDVVIL